MNSDIRAKVIEVYKEYVVIVAEGIVAKLQQQGISSQEAYRTIHMMKDSGELFHEGQAGLRLSLKALQSLAPKREQWKKYVLDNWLVLTALGLSIVGTLSGVAGTVIALLALFKSGGS